MSQSADLIDDVATHLEAVLHTHPTAQVNPPALEAFRREARRLMDAPPEAGALALDLLVFANDYYSAGSQVRYRDGARGLRETMLGRLRLLRDCAARHRTDVEPSGE